jgi:acetyltransferase
MGFISKGCGMTIRNLQFLFKPQSVAVIGASSRAHALGTIVLQNLRDSGFAGPVYPVNPKYDTLLDWPVYDAVSDLPQAPDLAIICTPASTVVGLIKDLGSRGTRAVMVASDGLDASHGFLGKTIRQAMLEAAKPYLLRILGPNSVGLLVPGIGLNASFALGSASHGSIAFVAQSGALVSGVLDWARSREIGFSKFVSLGESADIDVADLLNYLASDNDTEAILLYLEQVRGARKFMSAARAAARGKPVIVLKTGWGEEPRAMPEAAGNGNSNSNGNGNGNGNGNATGNDMTLHAGVLSGPDLALDAALRRAGMLRVFSTEGLFNAVETLARARRTFGERLAIVSNGRALAALAHDALMGRHGRLAELAPATLSQLAKLLPKRWQGGNPVDIGSDAPPERYAAVIKLVLADPGVDAVLLLHAPTALVSSTEIAEAILPVLAEMLGEGSGYSHSHVFACWLGGASVGRARNLFSEAGVACYYTPEKAVYGFMQIVQYHRNQALLMEVPAAERGDEVPDRALARSLVARALARGETILSEPETKQVLAAYGIPVLATQKVASVRAALDCAQQIGYPVALKVLVPQLGHKSDIGGVALDLETPEALRIAAAGMRKRIKRLRPDLQLQGFTLQKMVRRVDGHELFIGVTTDPVFGPVILFGEGGVAVEVMADHATGLPPLNQVLARDLISRTRIARQLAGFRHRPGVDLDALCRTLIQVSHLVIDVPELVELDINPLLSDVDGVLALDARMRIGPLAKSSSGSKGGSKGSKGGDDRLAIRPYPEDLEQWLAWQGEQLLLRPIKPEDGPQHLAFFNLLDAEDVRFRTFSSMRELQPSRLARLTQIDYDREMAFIATRICEKGGFETLGVVRAVADPDNVSAEFAIIVRSDLKGKGLGRILFAKLIDYFRARGTQEMVGDALGHNTGVQDLVRRFGFEINSVPGDGTVRMRLDLQASAKA